MLAALQPPVERSLQKISRDRDDLSYDIIDATIEGAISRLAQSRCKLRRDDYPPLAEIRVGRANMGKTVLARKVEEVDVISTGALWKRMLAVRTVSNVCHLFAADATLKTWRSPEIPMFSFVLAETTLQMIGSKIMIRSPSLGGKVQLRKSRLLETKRFYNEVASVATVLDSSGAVVKKLSRHDN